LYPIGQGAEAGKREVQMSNIVAGISLQELTFPDITGKTQGAWGTVSFGYGLNYTTGGIPMGLVLFADQRTVDFNGFLWCDVHDESAANDATLYTFRYVPATDTLQIFVNGVELANGAALSTGLLIDSSVIFHAVWDRTTVRG